MTGQRVQGSRFKLRRLGVWLVLFAGLSAAPPPPAPSRIVSLIPAVTEMLFAIGAGPQVIGVGSFDRYPPEAATRVRVGGLIDPDLERILSLRPDLVIAYGTQVDLRRQLERAGIAMFLYEHEGLADVTSTIAALGTRAGREADAAALVGRIEQALADVRARVEGRPRPRTLLVFGRDAGALRSIYASGGRGFLHDMLDAAGGANVFADVDRQAVQATSELILARSPDVIIEFGVAPRGEGTGGASPWTALASMPAIRDGRVHVLEGEHLVVPGPRVADATRRLAEALHPDAFR